MSHQIPGQMGWVIHLLDRCIGSSITWTGHEDLGHHKSVQKMIGGHTHFQGVLVDAMG